MPGNTAGTAGTFLSSTGAGTAPVWSALDTSSIANFSQKVWDMFSGTAPITYSDGQIGITQASGSTNGYLSNTDWTTFNNKLTTVDTTNIANFYTKVRNEFTGLAPLSITNGQIGISQASTSTNGYLSSADWNAFNTKLGSIDTTNIANFYTKVRSEFTGLGPIRITNGQIGMTQASTSTNGYLSSTDWNSFNTKLASIDTTNIANFYTKSEKSNLPDRHPSPMTNGLIGDLAGNHIHEWIFEQC